MSGETSFYARIRPRFGQWTVWLLCLFAIILAVYPFTKEVGERQSMATMIGWLPDGVLGSDLLFLSTRIWLLLSAIAWASQRLVPWSSWSTAMSFTLMWSLRMENTSHAAHIFNATNMLIVVHAIWYHVERRAIRESSRNGTFWEAPVYPIWVFRLSVFYLCWFHMWAGLTKLNTTGLDWGNGLSLQLWVNMWGWPSSPSTQLILSNRTLTQILQTGALIFETTAIIGILNKYCRWWVGFTLFGFYAGVLTTFIDYGFHMNAILVAWFLLPTFEWLASPTPKPSPPETLETAASSAE